MRSGDADLTAGEIDGVAAAGEVQHGLDGHGYISDRP